MADGRATIRLFAQALDPEPSWCEGCQLSCIEADVLVVDTATLRVFARMRVRWCDRCEQETIL